jgi:hypothetical protein
MALGAVDGQHLDPDQPGLSTEAEDLSANPLVTLTEASDRGVIGRPIGGDHADRDVSMQRRSIRHDDRSPIA